MGVSFAAKLAVGVKLGKVWEVRTITEEVKKFRVYLVSYVSY